jgi:hypothetical protein
MRTVSDMVIDFHQLLVQRQAGISSIPAPRQVNTAASNATAPAAAFPHAPTTLSRPARRRPTPKNVGICPPTGPIPTQIGV